jgi:predicted glycosyltransferase
MRLLFDLGHPAHVHLFRNLIKRVTCEGGDVLAASRDKDVTVDLCKAYEIPQRVLSRAYSGNFITGFREFVQRTVKLLRIAQRFKPDALLGTSMSIGPVGRIMRRPSFVFNEDDAAYVPLFANFVYPACTHVVTPDCLKHEDYGAKHLMYPGYHELAYLHPDHFKPDPAVPRSIGLDIDKPYYIIRFVSLKAHHDMRAGGLSFEAAKKLVNMLSNHGRVLITTEGQLHDEFKNYQFPLPPEKLHDVLAFASMYIGDSQTVSIEAAVLGVPGMRCNTFVGRITCLEELEKKYGLTVGFLPGETDMLIAKTQEWIADLENVKRQMQTRRTKMLEEKINLVDWQWRTLCEKLNF